MENQRRIEELRIEIQRQKLELDKSAKIRQQIFKGQEKLFAISNRGQNVENENAFSQNARYSWTYQIRQLYITQKTQRPDINWSGTIVNWIIQPKNVSLP